MALVFLKHFFHVQCRLFVVHKGIYFEIALKASEIYVGRPTGHQRIIAHQRLGVQETLLIKEHPVSYTHMPMPTKLEEKVAGGEG